MERNAINIINLIKYIIEGNNNCIVKLEHAIKPKSILPLKRSKRYKLATY